MFEILRSLMLHEATFPCHETTVATGNEDGDLGWGDTTEHCAGALIILEKFELYTQPLQIGERLQIYHPERLDMSSPVFDSVEAAVAHHSNERDERLGLPVEFSPRELRHLKTIRRR